MTGSEETSLEKQHEQNGNLKEKGEDKKKEDKKILFGLSKQQLVTMIIFGLANILSTAIISVQAPFYPKQAEEIGASATEYGLVFGVFQLTTFIFAPIFGTLMGRRVNPKMIFDIGMFTTSISTILFGFLDYFDDRITFVALSFALRIVQGLGVAAFMSSSFTAIAIYFPESVATTFATFETCAGVGLICGPTIGGMFYEVGGFILPFATMGSLLLIVGLVAHFVVPRVDVEVVAKSDTDVLPGSTGFGFISLVKIPEVALAAFSISMDSSATGYLEATLEPHLRDNFGLTAFYTGLVFVIDGVIYSITTPMWGKLCDRIHQPKIYTIVGCLLTFVAFLIIGPVSFIPLEPILLVTCVGVGIHSMGTGASLVAGFVLAMDEALKHGFPDGVHTYGLVSALWVSFFSLGNFLGPTVAGILQDTVGFRVGTIYVLATQVLVIVCVLLSIWNQSRKNSNSNSNSNFSQSNSNSYKISDPEKNLLIDSRKLSESIKLTSSLENYGAI